MSATRHLAVLAAALLTASSLGAQRPGLPFGLRAGRRDVGIRVLAVDHQVATAWYPAACARRSAAPANPCRDAAPDSGLFPLLVLEPSGIAALDTARSIYFASHGYVVVLGPVADARSAARALPFVDPTQVVSAGAGGASVPGGRGIHDLTWGVAPRTAGRRMFVAIPPGPSSHFRLGTAVTHAFLDAALNRGSLTVPDLILRLHRAGLDVCCSSTH